MAALLMACKRAVSRVAATENGTNRRCSTRHLSTRVKIWGITQKKFIISLTRAKWHGPWDGNQQSKRPLQAIIKKFGCVSQEILKLFMWKTIKRNHTSYPEERETTIPNEEIKETRSIHVASLKKNQLILLALTCYNLTIWKRCFNKYG